MKNLEFENMVKSAPKGATHYRRHQNCVNFFRNVDSKYGSFDELMWFSGDSEPFGEWFTKRRYLKMDGVIKL